MALAVDFNVSSLLLYLLSYNYNSALAMELMFWFFFFGGGSDRVCLSLLLKLNPSINYGLKPMVSFISSNKLLKMVHSSIIELPCPSNISAMWNFGSLLGFFLSVQIASGLGLAMHYGSDVSIAFFSVNHIMRDVCLGWEFRVVHANGASLFFICMYIHLSRGLYYSSHTLKHVWLIGCTILLITMATAFLGYVLPWGQMSFWGATVITNLFSAVPFIGSDIVFWLWGGFAIGNASLTRFFTLHFILPFLIAALSGIHLFFLHISGSSNPLGLINNTDKIKFNPYFSWKDLLGVMVIIQLFAFFCFFYPWLLGDPENFISANPMVTPVHIQPEWYFLFAYAILRSIPNKLGGVLALFLSVLVFYTLPFFSLYKVNSLSFLPANKFMFWSFVSVVVLLTWIGSCPVESPYIITGQILSVLYFFWFVIDNQIKIYWLSNI